MPTSATGDLATVARGEASAVAGKLADARRYANLLAARVKQTPDDTDAKMERLLVEARIAEAKHDENAAIVDLTRAVALQDGKGYQEPPTFPFPIRERLGETLLGIGRAADAKVVFTQDLQHTPGNSRSIAGLNAIDATPHPPSAASVQQTALPSSGVSSPASSPTLPLPSASPSPR